jgi:hypothetical protein
MRQLPPRIYIKHCLRTPVEGSVRRWNLRHRKKRPTATQAQAGDAKSSAGPSRRDLRARPETAIATLPSRHPSRQGLPCATEFVAKSILTLLRGFRCGVGKPLRVTNLENQKDGHQSKSDTVGQDDDPVAYKGALHDPQAEPGGEDNKGFE